MATIVQDFQTTGIWTCPAGVTSVQAEAYGGGGNGSGRTSSGAGAGGSGGTWAKTNAITVVPGVTYTVTVGGPASDSWFSTTGIAPISTAVGVLAKGGISLGNNVTTGASAPGTGSCIGDSVADGGAGANSATNGGGGGESGGPNGAGTAGSGTTGGTGHADAGNGGDGQVTASNPGNPAIRSGGGNGNAGGVGGLSGTWAGGAGGGAKRTSGTQAGGPGAPGLVRLTYTYAVNTYVTSWTENYINNGTIGDLVKPGDVQTGDLLVYWAGGVSGTTPPTGFSTVGSGNGTYYATKIATGSEPATYSSTTGAGQYGSALMVCVRGINSSNPVPSSTNNSGSGTTTNPGAVTPTLADSLLLYFNTTVNAEGVNFSAYSVTTTPPTFIEMLDMDEGNGVVIVGFAWGVRSATTSTTAGTTTISGSVGWQSSMLAISPPVAGSTGNFFIFFG